MRSDRQPCLPGRFINHQGSLLRRITACNPVFCPVYHDQYFSANRNPTPCWMGRCRGRCKSKRHANPEIITVSLTHNSGCSASCRHHKNTFCAELHSSLYQKPKNELDIRLGYQESARFIKAPHRPLPSSPGPEPSAPPS
jgi:hypothetical protein